MLTTLFAYLGVVVGYFNVLWLLPFVLEPNQVGLFKTIQDLAILLVPFAQLGIGNGITRFFPLVEGSKFSLLTQTLTVGVIGFVVIAGLFVFFQDTVIAVFARNAPDVNDYLLVALLITLFSLLSTILESFCRSYLKVAFPSFIRDVLLRLLIALLVLGYYIKLYSFSALMWGLGGVYLLALLAMMTYMVRSKLFQLTLNWQNLDRKFRKSFFSYSFITLLGTAGALLIMKIDSLMVSSLIGLDANAVYIIGFSIAVVIEMPRRAISQVIMPVISEKFAVDQLDDIHQIYRKVAVNQLLICLLIFGLIWLNIDNLYHFVPNREIYQAGKWVVFLIGMGKITDALFSVNSEIIVFSKFYLFNITATLIMCIAVIMFNFWLIPIWDIEGAAMASFMAMLLYNLIKFIYIKVRLGFSPFSIALLKIVLIGAFSWSIAQFVVPGLETVLLDLVLKSSVFVFCYLLGSKLWQVSPESENWIKDRVAHVWSTVKKS
nr:oligosaccharide flippase family protein [Lunatimonas salinarum]